MPTKGLFKKALNQASHCLLYFKAKYLTLIDLIPNENIDFKKWDRCIKKAFNGNIFAYSWYLNIVSQKWHALVENDYERVMPLPFSNIAGNEIIVQPKLAGPLGIFSISTLSEKIVSGFINSIPSEYPYINLKLNKHNQVHESVRKSGKRIHQDIDLIKPYEKLREIYPDYFNHLLETAYRLDFRIDTKVPVDAISRFGQKKSPLYAYLHPEELITMQLLVSASVSYKMGQVCGVYGNNNQLIAVAFFVWSHQKATMSFCLFNDKKLQLAAFFFLIDDFIRNNSEKNLILHFEINSNSKLVPLLGKIGAKTSESFYLYRNILPWYLKPFVA